MLPKVSKKQGIFPAFAIPYYTIPKLIRELKLRRATPANRVHYTIPKLIRELKQYGELYTRPHYYTIPKLIRELKPFVSAGY